MKRIFSILLLPVIVFSQDEQKDLSYGLKDFIAKNIEEKKQFLLPDIDPLLLPPEEFLKQQMLSFTPKKSKPYSPLIQKIIFGFDISDLMWAVKSWLRDGNDYFYQFNIFPIGLFFRHGIFIGLDGGYSWIAGNSSGPFVNVSFGWEYFNTGFCRVFIGGAKVQQKYPLWWMITPFSKTFDLLEINSSWCLNLHVEIFFKRLIKDCGIQKIPFFGNTKAFNIKGTYFCFRFYLELQYIKIDDKISF